MNKNIKASTNTDNPFIFGTQETCLFFDIHRDTLSDWAKRGAPKEKRGLWDLKKLIEWKYGTGDKQELSLESRKLQADVRYRETKADVEEIKKFEKVGQYVSVEDVEKNLVELFTRIKQGLLFLGHRIAAEMNAQYPELALDAKRLTDEEIERALRQLATTGTYGRKQRAGNAKKGNK